MYLVCNILYIIFCIYLYIIFSLLVFFKNQEQCQVYIGGNKKRNKKGGWGGAKKFNKFNSVYDRHLPGCILHTYDALNESAYAEMPGEYSAI